MAEQRWVTINGHHVLLNDDEGFDTGKSDAKKGKVVSGKGAVKDVQGKKWHSETEEERAAIDKRMENARKIGIKNDVYGQLGFGNFSDEALQKAVDRGWITQEESDKISGKKAWKDMTHQERVAEMQKDGERYAKDPTIADKEKWSDDYKREVIDYARPIMAEKRRSATIKSPGGQTKKQRLEAARQEVENAKNIEDVSASQLAKKYNLSSEEAGQLVWNRTSKSTTTKSSDKVTTDRGLKKPGKTVSLEEKKEYLRKNNLAKFAKELNSEGNNTEAAVNYVYDQNTLSKEDFAKKYGISKATNKTKSAVIKNPGVKKGTVSDEAYKRSQEGGRPEYGETGKTKKQTTQNKVDKLLSGRSAAASANMSKEINYQSRRMYGKSWDSLREDERADVYEALKRHHPEWF